MSIDNASPADWDRTREHYLKQLEDEQIICSPKEHTIAEAYTLTTDDFTDNVRPDVVNNPQHYGQGAIECIEYIEDVLSEDEYIGYLRGNITKYLHRWRYKNGLEDLKKAQWYLNRLVEYKDV